MDNSSYVEGRGLGDDERRLVGNRSDLWKLEVLHEMSVRELDVLAQCFVPKDQINYNEHFRANWRRDWEYFLGQRVGHNPTHQEREEDLRRNHLEQRALLFHVMDSPDSILLQEGLPYQHRLEVEVFLGTIEEISGARYLEKFGFTRED